MNFDLYKNTLPYPSLSDPGARDAREAWRNENNRLNEKFKEDLFDDLGITNHPKRERLFSMAWSDGHASGLSEVYNHACELVELIQD